MSRLISNEKSLRAKDKLSVFNTVMQEYLDLNHAHIILKSEIPRTPHCYLPVHGVFKDSFTTTKVRAIFDASARYSTHNSFNDTLLAGPSLYSPLPDVLLRFRRHAVGMSADISKMFREILLNPEECDFHRFVMRSTSGSILDCRMDRLTFGVKCSPFLATQVLRTLADLHHYSHPSASTAIKESFYVDDFLSGADTVELANALRIELCDLLSQAGMVLRKWRSSSMELLEKVPDQLREKETTPVDLQSSYQKALGVHWDTVSDSLFIAIPCFSHPTEPITKRVIAAGTAGVFDVLGLFCPAVIPARIIFQDTWRKNLSWDKPVPEDIKTHWQTLDSGFAFHPQPSCTYMFSTWSHTHLRGTSWIL